MEKPQSEVTATSSVATIDEDIAVQRLREEFPDVPFHVLVFRGQTTVVLPREVLIDVCQFLKTAPDLRFNQLADVTCADFPGRVGRFEVIYNLVSFSRVARLRLKVLLEDGDEHVTSVTGVWLSATALEREVYDLFGIIFDDHPNLKRILLPDHWQGYPLRRDHPIGGEEVGFTS